MIIRQLNKNDVFQHERVASQSFVYGCDVDCENNELPSQIMLGAFADDNITLMADMEIGDRKCNFEGETLTCAAVGGVASKPEYRNKGSVRRMFDVLFNAEALKKDFDISILYPFSASYYKKFGYAGMGYSVCIKVPFSEFSHIERCSDVFLYEGKNPEKLTELYNSTFCKYNLSFVRTDGSHFCSEPYLTKEYVYILNDYRAYISISVDRDESTVFVKEIGYSDKESLLNIIGFLRSFEGNQKFAVFKKLPLNTPVLEIVRDINNCVIEMKSTGAARVLDVESVLGKIKYPQSGGSFSIECTDTVEKNNGIFRIEYYKGTADIRKINSGRGDVLLNPSGFSRLLLNGVPEFDLREFNDGIVINNYNSDLFKVFTPKNTFFNDEF